MELAQFLIKSLKRPSNHKNTVQIILIDSNRDHPSLLAIFIQSQLDWQKGSFIPFGYQAETVAFF